MQDRPSLIIRLPEEPKGSAPASGRSSGRGFEQRHRNRHGRGLRGELIPLTLPASRSRAERFDDWVMESAERLELLWGERLNPVQFVVRDIPDGLEELAATRAQIPLGSSTAAADSKPSVITVYRHPVEMAASGFLPVSEMVHDVVVEQAAELLGMAPEAVDPSYGRSRT